jgi:nucleoid-associated protein YgaU
MFVPKPIAVLVVALLVVFVALYAARPTRSAGPETRYVVQPGDTLWTIASARYDGDPRAAIWRIKERNGLETSTLAPGLVLQLPG